MVLKRVLIGSHDLPVVFCGGFFLYFIGGLLGSFLGRPRGFGGSGLLSFFKFIFFGVFVSSFCFCFDVALATFLMTALSFRLLFRASSFFRTARRFGRALSGTGFAVFVEARAVTGSRGRPSFTLSGAAVEGF